MSKTQTVEHLANGFEFIEAPRAAADGSVWFADLTGKGVYRLTTAGEIQTKVANRQWVGGILFDESGAVLMSGRGGVVALDQSGNIHPLLSEIEGEPVIAVNDMEADGHGGFFGGSIDFVSIMETGAEPKPGKLFHMAADGTVTVLRRDVFASNGLGFSPDGRYLYHSETSRGVWRYPLDAKGMPGAGELIIPLEDSDGLVVDREGGIWVACWSSGTLQHFDKAGQQTQLLTFDQPHIVSLAFGAKDPSFLYIATGGNDDHPGAGGILRMRVTVPGQPEHLTHLSQLGI